MESRKRKWWILPLVLILAAVLALGIFWDTAKVYLAPKTVLTEALTGTFHALQTRFSGSPLLVIGRGLDEKGCNTVKLQMDKENALLGQVRYDMILQTNRNPKQVLASGTVSSGGSDFNLKLYLDGEYAAVASAELLGGKYYGITYDTFSQDIRGNGILAFLLGESTISEWEASVAELQKTMAGGTELPDIAVEDMQLAMVGLLALKAEVSRESVELSRGAQESFRIHFSVPGALILEAADYAQMELPVAVDADSEISADFYLAEDTVVRMDFYLTGPESYHIRLTPDLYPATDSVNVQLDHKKDGAEENYAIAISTISSDSLYTEEVSIRSNTAEENGEYVLRYSWNHTTGDAQLSRMEGGSSRSVTLNLTGTEEGFRIETTDLDALLAVLGTGADEADTPATLTVSKGSQFDAPEYKNFDQWSMEDLLALLGSVGALLGLKL